MYVKDFGRLVWLQKWLDQWIIVVPFTTTSADGQTDGVGLQTHGEHCIMLKETFIVVLMLFLVELVGYLLKK